MIMLISKNENVKESSVYIGSLVLKLFKQKKQDKLSVFEVFEYLKKFNITHYRQVIFGLSFLYSTGIIEFKEPYIYVSKN